MRLSEEDIEAGFFSPKDNGKSQVNYPLMSIDHESTSKVFTLAIMAR